MEVEAGREDVLGEVVDLLAEAGWDVGIAEVLADDGAVLGPDQGIVIGAAGAGLCKLLDMELVEQAGVPLVGVLRAVTGVEPVDGEGEGGDERFEDAQEEIL